MLTKDKECDYRYQRGTEQIAVCVASVIATAIETKTPPSQNSFFVGEMCAITQTPCRFLKRTEGDCEVAIGHESSQTAQTPQPGTQI